MAVNKGRAVWLCSSDPELRKLVRAALTSQRIALLDLPLESLLSGGVAAGALPPPARSLLLVDRAGEFKDAPGLVDVLRSALALPWHPRVLAIFPAARAAWHNEVDWVRARSGHAMLERPQAASIASVTDMLRAVMTELGGKPGGGEPGGSEPDVASLESHLAALGGPPGAETPAMRMWRLIATTPDALAAALLRGMDIRERRHRLRKHAECFVGGEACDWLQQVFHVRRKDAVALGAALLESGHLHHVTRQHPFRDGDHLYRAASPGTFDRVALDIAVAFLRAAPGLVADRSWRGRAFSALHGWYRSGRCAGVAFRADAGRGHVAGPEPGRARPAAPRRQRPRIRRCPFVLPPGR